MIYTAANKIHSNRIFGFKLLLLCTVPVTAVWRIHIYIYSLPSCDHKITSNGSLYTLLYVDLSVLNLWLGVAIINLLVLPIGGAYALL